MIAHVAVLPLSSGRHGLILQVCHGASLAREAGEVQVAKEHISRSTQQMRNGHDERKNIGECYISKL